MPSRALRHPDIERRLAAAPQWPSYTGVSQLVGTTADGRCTVYVDPSLGAPVLQNAQDLLADAPRIMKFNDDTFGVVGGHVDVIVFALGGMTDGTGGADHMGCDFTSGAQIEIDASFGQSDRVSALFEAELSECAMNNQLCGLSTGEALSRWCAMLLSNDALSDFASAPDWYANGAPNFVDVTNPNDRDYPPIGCGMAFISWVMAAHNITLAQVAQQMVVLGDGGTLASLYSALHLGLITEAWPKFKAAVNAQVAHGGFPQTDDPFGAMSQPQPGPNPTPTPTPSPGVSALEWIKLAIEAMFAGYEKGEPAAQIKADVNGIPT